MAEANEQASAGQAAVLSDESLGKLLKRDSLREAEQLTGMSYKENDGVTMVGLGIAVDLSDQKDKALRAAGDSSFSNALSDYQAIIAAEGFRCVLQIPFTVIWGPTETQHEQFFIYFDDRRGVLLVFDTFGGSRVNGGKFYYNVRPKDRDAGMGYAGSSGGYRFCPHNGSCRDADDLVWAGDHDCREAIRFHLRQLESAGEFIMPWKVQPHLWLCHHGDTQGDGAEDYSRIRQDRIAMLPLDVQAAIAGEWTQP